MCSGISVSLFCSAMQFSWNAISTSRNKMFHNFAFISLIWWWLHFVVFWTVKFPTQLDQKFLHFVFFVHGKHSFLSVEIDENEFPWCNNLLYSLHSMLSLLVIPFYVFFVWVWYSSSTMHNSWNFSACWHFCEYFDFWFNVNMHQNGNSKFSRH